MILALLNQKGGVGKTTLEMFLLTLTRKWNPAPRLVLFDLDRGCEIAMRAIGGRYLALEAGIDVDDGTRHQARGGRGEEEDGARDVVRLAPARHRRAVD